jgi:hypothetical protein
LSTKLKRRHTRGALLAGLALSIAILAALLPGWAEAQEVRSDAVSTETAQDNRNDQTNVAGEATTAAMPELGAHEPAAALVLEPGDSLWAIAQERLGPEAFPQQVAEETGRIYGLNRHRIGDNPNLLAEGQELSLAPVSGPSGDIPQTEPVVVVAGPPVAAAEEQPATQEQPTEPGRGVEDAGEPKEQGASTAVESSLPEPYNAQHQQRRLLGLGVLALTLLLAILAALRLPLRRSVGRPQPRATSPAYANRQASGVGRLGDALAVDGRPKKILPGRAPGAKRLPPRKLGSAPVYSPQVRRSLRRAQRVESREKVAVTSHPGALIIGLALSLAVLTGLPGTAEAQDVASEHHARTANQTAYETTAQPDPPDRLVVHPGDSLWSISRERLGPSASPEQIANEVRRTSELNWERIGDDPNLIFPGQELLLAQGPEPATNAPTTGFAAPPEPASAERPTSDEAVFEPDDEPAPEPGAEQPAAEDDPTAGNVEASSLVERIRLPLLVPLGFFLFALAVAVFGAWKLLTTKRVLANRNGQKGLGGAPVWVRGPHREATLLVERALEANANVYVGKEPPTGEAPSSIILCPNGEGVAQEMRRLRSLAPDAPILVLGPRVEPQLARTALLAGAHGFIHVGMQPAQIARALSAVSEGYAVVPKELLDFFLAEMVSREDRAGLTPDQREFLELVLLERVATSAGVSTDEIVVPRDLLEAFLRKEEVA